VRRVSLVVTIERMAYGPHGVARYDGQVLFVRGALPGETVRVTLREDHRTYAYADVEEVLSPSPARRVPPCPYLPRCGGCPWQHWEYSAQLAAKVANVRDHFERIAHLSSPPLEPPIPAPAEFGYRHRLSLRVANRELGFYAAASHDLVPVEHCLLGNETTNAAFPAARALVRALRSEIRRVEIAADACSPTVVIAAEVEGGFVAADDPIVRDWLLAHPIVQGCMLRGKRWRRVWGEPRITVAPEPGLLLRLHAGVFSQVHPAANQILVATVVAFSDLRGPEHVVDAYAGAGNFTFALARRSTAVTAIEVDATAAADLADNVEQLGASNVRVWTTPTERGLADLARQAAKVDTLVLDPPRSGAREAVASIRQLRPKRIVYVSCNSATLARDVALLSPLYRLERVRVIDLFPQTYHVETVALLLLT